MFQHFCLFINNHPKAWRDNVQMESSNHLSKKLYTCDTYNTSVNMGKEVFLPVRIERGMLRELTQLGEKHGYKSRSELVREAIEDKIAQLKGVEIVKIRNIPKSKAKKEILAYIRNKDRVYASDIAFDLRLDLGLVFEIVDELFGEEKLEEVR